ncbi:hypothetical protein Q7C_85 [Methylophaga frappieri]|uniref:Uncharacterized protein n=1 Tax=Methylophaga frappieri (strain ATCC BAA-2434 / DSM 25690 / JAM7) TaxID=754477 RepID=I1YEC3_METFJ|nr:hypothetical protein Q7C_85 [Methylophaga frappieri]
MAERLIGINNGNVIKNRDVSLLMKEKTLPSWHCVLLA